MTGIARRVRQILLNAEVLFSCSDGFGFVPQRELYLIYSGPILVR